jgi:prepilin-type N-terminal cleavage/methylation domain-containing protein
MKKNGFTLIELVIAIFILVVAIIGVYNAFSIIVVMTTDSSSRFTAAYLAQDGMEIIRNIRDNNWVLDQPWKTGLTGCEAGCEADYKTGTSQEITPLREYPEGGNYLRINDNNGFYSYDETGEYATTKFKRKITIEEDPMNEDTLYVSVEVTWNEKGEEGCDYGNCIEVEEKLYDWY